MENFEENVREVDRLAEIHSQITTTGPGRRYNVQILHKSSMVLLVACWEAFIEDLADAALAFMIRAGTDHRILPDSVLERVANQHAGLRAWELAGEGWRNALRANLQGVLAKTTGTLNTPKTAQIDELFQKTIGLVKISTSWGWRGMTAMRSSRRLDEIVSVRGAIAHRVSAARQVRLADVRASREFISRLCVKSHNRVVEFLTDRAGSSPWERYWYSETA